MAFCSCLYCRHGGFDNTTQDERNAVPSQQQCNGHFVLYQSPVQIRGVWFSSVMRALI